MINGLGIRLQKQRQLMKLSQKEVATTLNISPSIISNYESGERTPSIENIMALAGLYKCSVDYLLGIDKSNSNHLIDTSMLNDEQHKLLTLFLESLK